MNHHYPALVLLLIGSFSGASRALAQGAVTDPGEPVISRMCLWNADPATWKLLNVKHRQIKLLNEIKLKYPAVVGGQWDVEDEGGDAMTPLDGTEHLTSGARPSPSATQPAGAHEQSVHGLPKAQSGMQADLRAVLTMKQLRAWASLCSARYSAPAQLRWKRTAVTR